VNHAHVSETGIGLLGLGTVGCGVVKALRSNGPQIAQRLGHTCSVRRCLVRDPAKRRGVDMDPGLITTDPTVVLSAPDIDVVIEVMGGVDPAKAYVERALRAGKHVITANKELLAKHGAELSALAHACGVRLLFEASVGGGIPIVRMVQGYMTANRIIRLRGILNGTCNFILTRMQDGGETFAAALTEAQRLGFAEADPTSDVSGRDSAYKIVILANMSFPGHVDVADVRRQGIEQITADDMHAASLIGGVIKLVAHADVRAGRTRLSVSPHVLSPDDPLAHVRGVDNAVTVTADVVGDLTFIGQGAGEYPTASSVIEDLVEVLRAPSVRGQAWIAGSADEGTDDEEEQGAFYSRVDFSGPPSQRPERMAEFARRLGGAALPILQSKTSEASVSYVLGDVSTSAAVAAVQRLGELRLLIPLSDQLLQRALERCAVS